MLEVSDSAIDLDFTHSAAFAAVAALEPEPPPPQPPQPAQAMQSAVEVGASAFSSTGYHVAITRREATRRIPFGKRTVLVIDADANLRMVLGHYLGKQGYVTRLAANRQQILAALQTPPLPDLILLDVEMPDADGFELLEKFQQSKVVGDIPVVMVTARCSRTDITRALTLGAAGYITKPAKLTLIGETLRALLGDLNCELAA